MKKVKLFNDNVLVKVEIVTSSIVLPDTKEKTQMTKAKSITVLEVGDGDSVKVKPGDSVVLGIDPLKTHNPYNNYLDTPEKTTSENCKAYYYFIKAFDIVAKVVK